MRLTDTHTHLHFDQYQDDLTRTIERARQTGIIRMLTLGTDLGTSQAAVQIAGRYEEVFAAVGIHPTDAHHAALKDAAAIKELAMSEEKVVAIGEIGLDLYWKDVPLQDQVPVLERMIVLAGELDLPVVIHNREAQKEMQSLFGEWGIDRLSGVMHSFAGNIRDAEFYLQRGMFISFTGVITFKNFKEMEVVKHVPLERLLLETDSPFLAPVPKRGKRNEPAYVKYTAEKLSEVHGVSVEEVCRITTGNASKLFRWDKSGEDL